jgi:cytochrome c oxidase subunit III
MPDSALTEFIESGGASGAGNGGASRSGGREGGGPFDGGRIPQRIYVTGTMIALGAIAMFFVALASASIVRKGLANTDWQPFELPRILWFNTLLLIASSATLVHSRRCFLAHQFNDFRHWWSVTTILGTFFIAGQVIAWWQLASSGVFLSTSPNSGFFYVFTVAHGLHLLGGIAGLLAVAWWPPGPMPRKTATEVVALYWHCMTALWLGVFLFLVATR